VASNFGSVIDCAGTIGINTVGSYTPKDVIADAANNEALVELVSLTGAISTISYHYIYRII
jgi:hypothetical protein